MYKDRLTLSVMARGLSGHLDGTTTRPSDPAVRDVQFDTLTKDEQAAVTKFGTDLGEWMQKEAIVTQQIASTIPDSLYLKIKGKKSVKEAWDLLKDDFEKRSRMFTIDLRRRLQEERCEENGNIRAHFDTMRTMREDLVALGDSISNSDFTAMLLGSLPKAYDSYLSAVTATISVLQKELDAEALMLSVIDEFDRCTVKTRQSKDKGRDTAFYAGEGSKGSKFGGKGSKKDLECFNCRKKGHMKVDCWAKGGGKEGQGPKGKRRKDLVGGSANTADDEDGVWMASLNDSDDEMADDEGEYSDDENDSDINDFWDFGDDDEYLPPPPGNSYFDIIHAAALFGYENAGYADDEYADMPDLLTVTDSSDDEGNDTADDDMPGLQEVSDSSDDEDNAPGIMIDSDSDSSDDLYGETVDYLVRQGLLAVVEGEGDEMPDQLEVSDSSDDLEILEGSEVECGEPMVLVEDNGESAYTTYDYAMLVNSAAVSNKIETELYDSGASRHMSPHRSQFENYISIVPKSITAADKRCFQAIGKGDLRVKVPNGHSMTTILLKDVLHCPDMGLTLISISRVAAAGYASLFRGSTCKIFDQRKKQIGEVHAKNGLYRVDHYAERREEMGGVAKEVLTVEELHRRMGHIAPDAAKRLVSEGAVTGIELDLSSELKSCDSCEYAKATRKPIKKTRDAPRAEKFGDEIHSDLWGPSPVQTPGKKEYYVSFTDDHSRWTHLELL